MAIFLGVAVLVAFAVLLGRRLVNAIEARKFALLPGRDPSRQVVITTYTAVDETLERTRCLCGGTFAKVSEGPASSASTGAPTTSTLVRAVGACRHCDRRIALYFDAAGVPQ